MHRQPFVLRMAGFPFDWLAELADEQTAVAADAVLTNGKAAAKAFRECYDAALARQRRAVVERFAGDEALRDALFALNPSACARIEHWLDRLSAEPDGWRADDRTKLDPIALYLQRMCAKNDSTGHAGPFAVGVIDPDVEGLRWTEAPLRHYAFLSRWTAEAILSWYAGMTAGATAVPRRAPGVAIDGQTVDHLVLDYNDYGDIASVIGPRTRPVELSAEDRDVLVHCDGERTVDDISAAVGRDAGPSVNRLAELGLIIPGPELPYGVADAMPLLSDLAANDESPELREIASCCAETLRVQAVGDRTERRQALERLAEVLERTAGTPTERGHGGFYQDRSLIYEESVGRVDGLVLGRSFAERLHEALPLITDTFLFLPRLSQRLEHDILAEWFATRFPAGTASVNDYLRGFADAAAGLEPAFERARRTLDDWHDRLAEAAGALGAEPDEAHPPERRERLQKFLSAHGLPIPAVCDIDLMLAAEPQATGLTEPTRLLVSEVHADEELLTHGMFAPFVAAACPTVAEEVLAAYQGLLTDDEILMNATVRHVDKTFARQPPQCLEIEAGDRSPLPRDLRRQLADLLVRLEPDGLRLIERATGRPVRLITPPLSWRRLPHNPMEVFGFPKRRTGTLFAVRPGGRLRRVAFDDLVLSRDAWSVPAGELTAKDAGDAFLAVRRLRAELGLPRHVFARTDDEGKPIYADLDSPLLVRQLTRFAARARHVRFTEMLPVPWELWLRLGGHTDTQTYTSELRFAAFDGRR